MIIYGVESNAVRVEECKEMLNILVFERLDQCLAFDSGITSAFIAVSPLGHSTLIHECLARGLHVFTEINLVDEGYSENITLAEKRGKVLFLSSTFLYREEVKFIMDKVKGYEGNLNYSYHRGQYLPDWHPWESYKDFFAGDKRTNGCREILAIDLPWLTKCFGDVTDIVVQKDKITMLDINYCDTYIIFLKHSSGHGGVFIVDVVARKPISSMKIWGENLQIEWDGTPEGLYCYNVENKEQENVYLYQSVEQLNNYSSNIIENAYYSEIVSFYEQIRNGREAEYTFHDDIKILNLIDRIEG